MPLHRGLAFSAFTLFLFLTSVHVEGDLSARRQAEAAAPPRAVDRELAAVGAYLEARLRGVDEAECQQLAQIIVKGARSGGLTPEMVLAVIEVESSGRLLARSSANALGLMQLRPATGRAVARQMGVEWYGPHTLFDPVLNVRLGIRYLESLRERFGDLPTALAAYNWGPTRIARAIARGRPVPMGYALRVLDVSEAARFDLGEKA